MICNLCPHRCGALRDETHGEGRCGLPSVAYVARAALHFGEEPCISGSRGSGTVFFSGCTLSCAFCQNREISRVTRSGGDVFEDCTNSADGHSRPPCVREAVERSETGGLSEFVQSRTTPPSAPIALTPPLAQGRQETRSGTVGDDAYDPFEDGAIGGIPSVRVAGKPVSAGRLAEIFRELEAQGAHNINLVSPTPHVPVILAALKLYRPSVPIVYNSSGFESVETLRALEGWVDVYLPDFKYADDALAAALSGCDGYSATAEAAIAEMIRQTGPVTLDEDGIIRHGTIVRHLVLPKHTNDSLRVLDILERLPSCYVSLMHQYTPVTEVKGHPELSRRLTRREYEKVSAHMLSKAFDDGYLQVGSSAGEEMIPAFDGTGV